MAQIEPFLSFDTVPDGVFYWVMAAWLFMVGGVLGSFLNVVIYRLPAGINLAWPGSHCPVCKHPIRWYDNVPILGWLILRGRCRDCHAAISPRYPIIEAITAGLFMLLGVVEFLGEGGNLPLAVEGPGMAAGIYVYHLLLLCTLLAAVMIEIDGHRVPVRLAGPALLVGLVAPLVWTRLHPVPASWQLLDGWTAGLVDGLAGLAAGLAAGWLAAWLGEPKQKTGTILAASCVGLFLGWQAVVGVTAAAAAVHLLLMSAIGRVLPAVRRLPLSAWLALAALGWILCWSRLVGTWVS